MIIFQKWNHVIAFSKMTIFTLIFTSHFHYEDLIFSNSAAAHSPPSMMPKGKKAPASKPPSKRVQKPSSKLAESAPLAVDSEDEEKDTAQPAKIRRTSWTTARTERLLDWLEENPADRQKLFSDSTKDAKEEGRRKRIAKGTKSEFHKLIATFVFSVDADEAVRADFAVNTLNYTKSVDNYLGR